MKEYQEVKLNGDVPKWMKLLMLFIDRVGFPALAFVLMFYMSYSSLEKVTSAISDTKDALVKLSVSTDSFQRSVIDEHKSFKECQQKLIDNLHGVVR